MPSALFYSDLKALMDASCDFYMKQANEKGFDRIRVRRANLAQNIESFHKECGTLTPLLEDRIATLRKDNCILLMTAHQPNLFPYSGVFRKPTLIFTLAKRLEERLKVPVVSFYGIADQDFTDDRWVRSFQLPSSTRKGGLLEIKLDLPNKKMLYKAPKPSRDAVNRMKAEIQKWFDDSIISIGGLLNDPSWPSDFKPALGSNLNAFWDLVEDCYESAETYSDFNSFLTSKIVNDLWRYDTLFARFSDCLPIFADETIFFLARFEEYSKALREAINQSEIEGVNGGVSNLEPELAPFWYHCDCGSKARMSMVQKDGTLFSQGNCIGCGRHYQLEFNKANPSLSSAAFRIFPRSIPMILTFFKGFLPSCYVGGVGGFTYLREAQHIAESMGIPLPPIAIWRPHDKYLGLGQMEALLQLKRIRGYFDSPDYSSTKELLERRISEMRTKSEELQESKRSIYKELEKNPDDDKLKAQLKSISANQAEINKASNFHGISRDLVILNNIPSTLYLTPSILDYAVNVGFKETSDQWMLFLINSGDLSSDVSLKSVLRGDSEQVCALSNDLIVLFDELRSNVLKTIDRSMESKYDGTDTRN